MVIYDLICDKNHSFEGWFKSEEDFKKQQNDDMLCCPLCDSSNVKKVPSASYVAFRNSARPTSESKAALSQDFKQQLVKELSHYIAGNSEDVGTRFAEEAKKIHYGETDNRAIRGQATKNEVRELNQEGIEVISLAGLPIDKDKLN